MRLPYPPPFMDLPTLAEHICAGESTIEHWVKQGFLPPPKKVGGKRLWRWKDVERSLSVADDGVKLADEQAERITEATRAATRQ